MICGSDSPGTPLVAMINLVSQLPEENEWAERSLVAHDRRPFTMAWFIRNFRIPASETNMGFVLALCIFTLSAMSIAIVWQAQVIARQNILLHQLTSRLGS
jgi:hypothetical protein